LRDIVFGVQDVPAVAERGLSAFVHA
jgi:hypothetical protein